MTAPMGVVSKNIIGDPRTPPKAPENKVHDAWNPAHANAKDLQQPRTSVGGEKIHSQVHSTHPAKVKIALVKPNAAYTLMNTPSDKSWLRELQRPRKILLLTYQT